MEKTTTMHSTDEELFSRYVDGDEESLNLLLSRYNNALYHYIMGKVKCPGTVDDILQTAFCKLVRYRNVFDQTKSFKAWLYTITDRVITDCLRRSRHRQKHTRNFSDLVINDQGRGTEEQKRDFLMDHETLEPAELVCKDDDARQALSLLRDLPEKYRTSIHFLVLQGLTTRQASQLLGATHAGIQKRAAKGLAILRQQMQLNKWGDETTLHEIEESVIADLVNDLPQEQLASFQRVHEGNGDENDHHVLGGFICRLIGAA